ncbi:MAG: DNA polymerase III subunit delta [Bacteroidia bacterium]|nr:DNA polymerase III subunit delta [Bacteroidia bacterium]
MKYEEILNHIRSQKFTPLYYLYGEESYFIDKIISTLDECVVPESCRSFNVDIIYGEEATANRLLSLAKSFPMMSERKLIIVKEAQRIKKDEFEKLTTYFEKPVQTTILAFACKDKKKPDGRLKWSKVLDKNGIVFESKSLYENQIANWLAQYVKQSSFTIAEDAQQIIATYLGNNLQIIENEISKIILTLKQQQKNHISKETVFDIIDIDKDYNVFELIDKISLREPEKCHQIITQMLRNPRENPAIVIVYQLFVFFRDLSILKYRHAETDSSIAQILGINPFFVKRYKTALQQFTFTRIKQNLQYILEADLALKGIINTRIGDGHILKTLIIKLLQ